MIYFICILVSLLACTAGAICGIGGGILIKPVLDMTGRLSVSEASLLSGCTVLGMSLVTLFRRGGAQGAIDWRRTGALAVGAAGGGLLGKHLFFLVQEGMGQRGAGILQAALLLLLTVFTLLYSLWQTRFQRGNVKSLLICLAAGLGLGALSSFLGIGGGPVNLMVLGLLFGMNAKTAALNSLYIIFLSQSAGVAQMALKGSFAGADFLLLFLMIAAGVAGGFCGSALRKTMDEGRVKRLLEITMVIIILICGYNILKLL